MKLYYEIVKALFKLKIQRKPMGEVLKDLCSNLGVVYIKFAQILATQQSMGDYFTEEDRKILSAICSDCNPLPFSLIEEQIKKEYRGKENEYFTLIEEKPLGSASISQVHRAVLKTGEEVVLKVKRQDLTDQMKTDLKQLKKLFHRFGGLVKIKNQIGGDHALDLYLKWIEEETDFIHERQNIESYRSFADSVNGKGNATKEIRLPKVYDDLCTENIIVMEYIPHKTINQMELTPDSKKKIEEAMNSYLSLSFYALFHDQKIAFHGDPHAGNIYVDEEGNIGFLDMGLVFELTEEDTKLTKEFFFAAFSHNVPKLYELLEPMGNFQEEEKKQLFKDLEEYAKNIQGKNITSYFTDMISICIRYQIQPPNFLFCMAKAFLYLNGMNGIIENATTGFDLLKEQVLDYYFRKEMKLSKQVGIKGLQVGTSFLSNLLHYGFSYGLAKTMVDFEPVLEESRQISETAEEISSIVENIYQKKRR